MFLTRLRNFAALPAREQRLALTAIAWLALTRVALRAVSFNRVHALVAGPDIAPVRTTEARGDDWPRAVRRALLRASRSLPGCTCLVQSLVAERLLRRGGHAARLSIGVADTAPTGEARVTLDAHAWVESGGVLVTGDDPHGRYRVLATFGAG